MEIVFVLILITHKTQKNEVFKNCYQQIMQILVQSTSP